ncbi:MAG: zinc-ribbon domain containing protein [Candidatus Eremiobacteraeota bacterium]|nr:zinc-ribbon domain containing protein [Candidatus Eremiobacteraeota bacterium]
MLEDKQLPCKECGHTFIFSVRDQTFYAEKGFVNEPQRCRDCRMARKGQGAPGQSSGAHVNFETVCADCGMQTTVPFRPRGDRPVYCRACFMAHAPVAAV